MLFTAPTGKVTNKASLFLWKLGHLQRGGIQFIQFISVKSQFKHLKQVLWGPVKPNNLTMTDEFPGSKSS